MGLIKIKKGFSLIELIVGITILSIILLGASNLNFNRLNTKQELEIFTNSIKSNYENIRNSSLSGKGIGTNLILPKKWKIEYSKSGSGKIINSTFSGSRSVQNNNITFKPGFSISEIICLDLDGKNLKTIITGTGIIEFTGSNISLNGNCNNTNKILELTLKYKSEQKTIKINTLNGLAEIK